ncbi:hypothetical protein [Streptomyces sp. SGAir0957]
MHRQQGEPDPQVDREPGQGTDPDPLGEPQRGYPVIAQRPAQFDHGGVSRDLHPATS